MTDPYRLTTAASADTATARPTSATGLLRPLAWTLLVMSAVGNTVASAAQVPVGIQLVLGTMTLVCIAVLVTHRIRRNR